MIEDMYEEYEYEEEYVEPPICNKTISDVFPIEELNEMVSGRKKGCIYFIRIIGLTPVKIGFSAKPTPKERIQNYSSPYGIETVNYFPTINANLVEKEIHKTFSQYKEKGEWFNVTDEQINMIVLKYHAKYNTEKAQARMLIQTENVNELIKISRELKRPSVQITEQGTIKDVFIQYNPINEFKYKKDFLTYCGTTLNKSRSQTYRAFKKEAHLFEVDKDGKTVKIRLCA